MAMNMDGHELPTVHMTDEQFVAYYESQVWYPDGWALPWPSEKARYAQIKSEET